MTFEDMEYGTQYTTANVLQNRQLYNYVYNVMTKNTAS